MKINKVISNKNLVALSRREILSKFFTSAALFGAGALGYGGIRRSYASVSPSQDKGKASKDVYLDGQPPGIAFDSATTSWAKIRNDIASGENSDNYPLFQQLVEDKKYLVIDTPISVAQTIKLNLSNQIISGKNGGIITALPGMQDKFIFELDADYTKIQNVILDNPLLLKQQRGGRQGGISIQANFCEVENSYFYRMLQSIIASAKFAAYGTKIVNNWFLECLGAGDGMSNLQSSFGEDRGDAVTIWGSGTIITGNHAFCKDGEDARIAFHAEGLPNARKRRDFDRKDIILTNNLAKGSFRRHFAFENITNGVSIGNVSMGGATWWGESYTQSKNIIIKNCISFTSNSDNKNGAAWSPVRAAIALLNFNSGLDISSSILMESKSEGFGFAIATRTGDHDFSLSGNMINEGSKKNVAVYLNGPRMARLNGLYTKGFGRAVVLATTRSSTIYSNNCIHECNGNDDGFVIGKGAGGEVTSFGDKYLNVRTAFIIKNIDRISINNTT
ncbi:hypothetical protein, partial [Gibbsiella quercinecans]